VTKIIGFIGAGQMATALAAGFLKSGTLKRMELYASDVSRAAAERFLTATGAVFCDTNTELLQNAEVVFLAVKPQQMPDVLDGISGEPGIKEKLFVTIAAGLPIRFFEEKLGLSARIIRVMPNTPGLVGEAASALTPSKNAKDADIQLVRSLLETVGLAEQIPEKLMDAVTGLSGSGPAFAYMMVEAMSDAGVKMGLPRATAVQFAAQTLKGAAEMVLKTGDHPAVLKDRVMSPAGTTIAGVSALEDRGFRAAVMAAVEAATRRSQELSGAK
jgi:pyrroline-5-carboxylate reductase